MISLIENAISWDKIGNYDREKLRCKVRSAVLLTEKSCFELKLELNFIMPLEDEKKLKAQLTCGVPGLKSVNIKYIYKDPVLNKSDILRLALPRAIAEINGDFSPLTRTIHCDSAKIDEAEGKITIKAVGETVVGRLNAEVAYRFQEILSRDFGITQKIVFINDEEYTRKSEEAREAAYAAELAAAAKLAQEAASDPNRVYGGSAAKASGEGKNGYRGKAEGRTGENVRPQGGWRKKDKYQPVEGNLIMGKPIGDDAAFTDMRTVTAETGMVNLRGILFEKSERDVQNGTKKLVSLAITDGKTSIGLKCFCLPQKWDDINNNLDEGDYVKVHGEMKYDEYEKALIAMIDSIEKGERPVGRKDTCEEKRVELHAHTQMSAMDGLNPVKNLVHTAAMWGQPAVAVTDHGVVQAFPDAHSQAQDETKAGRPIKIIYGMEGYLVESEGYTDDDGKIEYKTQRSYHIIIIAKNQTGLKNLYKLVSYSHLNYFYKKPRLPRSVIEAHREGLILGSACSAGELYEAILEGKDESEIEKVASFYDYLEIQPLINNRFLTEDTVTAKGEHRSRRVQDIEGLRDINRRIVALADKLGKPVCATTDSHYAEPDDAIYRNILMAGMGYKDAEDGEGLYMRTTDEMLEEFAYLGGETARRVVIENTQAIMNMTEEILPVPKGKYPPKIDGAVETLKKTCYDRAHKIYGDPLPPFIQDRLDREVNSVCDNGYAVMYVSAQMLVKKSNDDGYLVGSRGSVGSSFAATMAGITEVNPLPVHYICPACKKLEWGDDIYGAGEYDCGNDMPPRKCPECGTMMKRDGFTIPFETFLGFEGDKEPDIDLNFAGEYQPIAHKYVGEIFGEKNVFKAGTVGTVADKTAYGYVMKYHEERGIPVNKFEADRLAKGCTGVKRTTGQHPGGMVICPDDHEIYEFCPVQHPANDVKSDMITTHFDYHKIDENLLKLDILGHDVPSQIRQLQELTGIDPQDTDLSDKDVLKIFNGIESLSIEDPDYKFTHGSYAIPEFGTSFVRGMLDDTKPDKFADLVRLSGFSHGTGVWLGNAKEFIKSGEATMKEVISTRDDIMNYLILKGLPNKTAFKIMENVRKGKVAKGKCKEWDEWKALMQENDVPDWYIESCQRIEYMFPRAHAVAYVMMSFRLAWFKVHFPAAFYAVYFTTKIDNFNSEVILRGKNAVLKEMELIEAKGKEASQKEGDEYLVYEVAYEMFARGFEFEPASFELSDATKFKIHYPESATADEKDYGKAGEAEHGKARVLLPFLALTGMGETAANALVRGYRERPYETVEDVRIRGGQNKSAIEVLRANGLLNGLPETDQLSLF